ncbi:hypothetical protein [Lentzea roselyniae]
MVSKSFSHELERLIRADMTTFPRAGLAITPGPRAETGAARGRASTGS